MTRAHFRTDAPYPARLHNVVHRPTENHLHDCNLLRLEFELFEAVDGRLTSLNRIASRDILLFPGVEKDSRVKEFARALRIARLADDLSWAKLKNAPSTNRPWVLICFGGISGVDQRQPFRTIEAFDPVALGFTVVEYLFPKDSGWVLVGEAARRLGCSLNTVRRKVDAYEPVFGKVLTWHTAGGHRRINLKLLRVLMNSADPA